jgi:stage V sporulation protein G
VNITQVTIRFPPVQKSKIRAFASIVLNEQLAIHDFRVIESSRGLFVSFPSRKSSDNQYHDVIQVLSSPLNELIRTTILRAYQDELARPERRIQSPVPLTNP